MGHYGRVNLWQSTVASPFCLVVVVRENSTEFAKAHCAVEPSEFWGCPLAGSTEKRNARATAIDAQHEQQQITTKK